MPFSLSDYLSVYLAGLCLSNYIRNSLQQLDSTVLSISFAHVGIHMVTQIQEQGVQLDMYIHLLMYAYMWPHRHRDRVSNWIYIHLLMYAYTWLHRYRNRVSNNIYLFAHVCIHVVTQIQGQGVQQDILICSCM